ncbi:hypothetical protein F4775DRAFT_474269 [Biscogniauxia sp. FL1348]|nr:hypothetical protein F4775DRAFT_474269 [Biscogniauxia sp. FL1348]
MYHWNKNTWAESAGTCAKQKTCVCVCKVQCRACLLLSAWVVWGQCGLGSVCTVRYRLALSRHLPGPWMVPTLTCWMYTLYLQWVTCIGWGCRLACFGITSFASDHPSSLSIFLARGGWGARGTTHIDRHGQKKKGKGK